MRYPSMNPVTARYWTSLEQELLQEAKSIADIYAIAEAILARMPDNLVQVCGPITNGGRGSIEENLQALNEMIAQLQSEGVQIFDQVPYEESIHRVRNTPEFMQTYEHVLSDFYERLFLSGKVAGMYFLSGWESTRGAMWEHENVKEYGFEIRYL